MGRPHYHAGAASQERVWAAPHMLCYMHACRPPSALQREQKINTQPDTLPPQTRGALTAPLHDATPEGVPQPTPNICRISLSHTTPQLHHPTIRNSPATRPTFRTRLESSECQQALLQKHVSAQLPSTNCLPPRSGLPPVVRHCCISRTSRVSSPPEDPFTKSWRRA